MEPGGRNWVCRSANTSAWSTTGPNDFCLLASEFADIVFLRPRSYVQSRAIGHDTHLGADFVETCRDGCGRSITSKHVALQHSRVLVSRHVSKVPETRTEDAWETEGACGRLQQIDQTIGLLVGQRVRMFICGRKRKRTNPDRRGDILPRWFYADDITTLNRY